MKYPREFPVALYHHNLGASIDEVQIGPALGWGIEIFAVLWLHN